MFTIQGRIEAFHTDTNPKTGEEIQGVSLYIMTSNFNKIKPAILDLRIPGSVTGLDKHVGKDAVFPITTYSKRESTDVKVNFSEDGRSVLVKNEQGQFVPLSKRPESLKSATSK